MAAPTIRGAEGSPYTGYVVSTLLEHALNERGLTADAASTEFVQASTAQKAKTRIFLRDGLAYLYSCRELWWPMREANATAEAQANGKFGMLALPAGCGRVEAVTIENRQLIALTLDEYLANLRPTDEGGELYLTGDADEPSYYRMVVAAGAASAAPVMALQILPEQDAAFTATVYFRASGQAFAADTDTVLLPLAIQPLLSLYVAYRWALDDVNHRAAEAIWGHLALRLEELSFLPPGTDVLPVIHSVLPSETATRST